MILEGSIKLPFSYAAGRVGSRFLVALRDEGIILGTRCETCGVVACPPRSFCHTCGADCDLLVEVGPGGTLEAWTETPERGSFGMIRLDGTDTALVHRLMASATPVTGQRVTARFATDRTGSINDIEGFEPERRSP